MYADPVLLSRTHKTQEALQALESDLRLYVAELARGKLFVHAGVVGWRGRAIVIPGRSFSGKSTLVAALVRAGATYYSDEYAVFDAKGRVHPYLAPLSIRTEPDVPGEKIQLEMLGGSVGKIPLPVGAIVVTKYEPDAAWRPRLASPGQDVLDLLANTVAARRKPAQALKRLSQVAATAPVYRGTRGEADEIATALLSRVATSLSQNPLQNHSLKATASLPSPYGHQLHTYAHVGRTSPPSPPSPVPGEGVGFLTLDGGGLR